MCVLKTQKQKNILLAKSARRIVFLVPLAGVEPARPQRRLILSQVRLPIPPQRHIDTEQNYIIIAICVCQPISCCDIIIKIQRPWVRGYTKEARK